MSFKYTPIRDLSVRSSTVSLVADKNDGRFVIKAIRNLVLNDSSKNDLLGLSHENVVKVVDLFKEDNAILIVSEYCNGGDLNELIKCYIEESRTIKEDIVFEWTKQIMKGLEHLHSKNIIHKNLKPSNVFLHDDIIKIGDFGIEPNNLNKNAETILAEMAYLAPEAFGLNGYSAKSDIWSAACVIYEIFTLKRCFNGENRDELKNSIKNDKIPELENSILIRQIINKMLNRSPEARPSAQFLLKILDNLSIAKSDYEKKIFDEISKTETAPNMLFGGEIIIKGKYKYIKSLKANRVLLVMDLNDKNKRRVLTQSNTNTTEDEKRRFERELKKLTDINSKKEFNRTFIVDYFGKIEDLGTTYIIMDYYGEGDLSEYIRKLSEKRRNISKDDPYKTMNMITQIMKGIYFLHSNGIAHRNLKPNNIYIHLNNQIKIGDLGEASTTESIQRTFIGRHDINYLSPELIDNGALSDKIDIWAAGCIIYELIELKKAFPGENMVQIQEKIKNTKPQLNLERYDNRNNKNLYVQVNGCIIKMLETEPNNRPYAKDMVTKMESLTPKQ